MGITLKLQRKASQISILREELHTCLLCDGRDKDGLKLSFDEEWKLRLVALYRQRQKIRGQKKRKTKIEKNKWEDVGVASRC